MDVTCLAVQLWQKCRRSAATAATTVPLCWVMNIVHSSLVNTQFIPPCQVNNILFTIHSPTNNAGWAFFSLSLTNKQIFYCHILLAHRNKFILLHWSEWFSLSPVCWVGSVTKHECATSRVSASFAPPSQFWKHIYCVYNNERIQRKKAGLI